MDVLLHVHILNLTYEVRGFGAIKDLKTWLDNNAWLMEDRAGPEPTTGEVG